MSKNVSLAIKKAMGNMSQINQNDLSIHGPKKHDLFSLSGDTELFQNEKVLCLYNYFSFWGYSDISS